MVLHPPFPGTDPDRPCTSPHRAAHWLNRQPTTCPRGSPMSIQPTAVRPDVPINPDTGEPFLYTMEVSSRRVHADTNEELVAAVLGDDYLDESDPETAFEVRLEGAITIATAIQESIVASAVKRGDLTSEEDESTWTPLLDPRETADPFGGRWEHRVPLVLVRALFTPYVDRSLPVGNILWIDPTDDITLLDSLQDSGLIRLLEHDVIPDAGDAA